MFLVDESNNDVIIYELKEDKKKAYKLKKDEMSKQVNKTYSLEGKLKSCYSIYPFELYDFLKEVPDKSDVFFHKSDEEYNILKYSKLSKKDEEELLEDFYAGRYNKSLVVRVKDNQKIKNLMVSTNVYTYLQDDNTYRMDEIINLTDKLYNLKLIEMGLIDLVDKEALESLLNLFTVDIKTTINKEDYEKLKDIGLIFIDSEKFANITNKDKIKIIKDRIINSWD